MPSRAAGGYDLTSEQKAKLYLQGKIQAQPVSQDWLTAEMKARQTAGGTYQYMPSGQTTQHPTAPTVSNQYQGGLSAEQLAAQNFGYTPSAGVDPATNDISHWLNPTGGGQVGGQVGGQSQGRDWSLQQQIDTLMEARRQNELARLQQAFDAQAGNVENRRKRIDPLFREESSRADATAIHASRRLSEGLANLGLGGESITAHTGLQTKQMDVMSGIERERTMAHTELDDQILLLQQALESGKLTAESQISYEHALASLQDKQRTQELGYKEEMDIFNKDMTVAQFNENVRQFEVGSAQWVESFEFTQERAKVGDAQWEAAYDTQWTQWEANFNQKKGEIEANTRMADLQYNLGLLSYDQSLMQTQLMEEQMADMALIRKHGAALTPELIEDVAMSMTAKANDAKKWYTLDTGKKIQDRQVEATKEYLQMVVELGLMSEQRSVELGIRVLYELGIADGKDRLK